MIGLGAVYLFAGLVFAVVAVTSALDRNNPRRFFNAAFWGLLAVSFLAGDVLGDFGNGVLVLALVAVAGFGLGIGRPATTTTEQRRESARRFGNTLFLIALTIPAITLLGSLAFKTIFVAGRPLVDPAQVTVVSLAAATIAAACIARMILKQPFATMLQEGRLLLDMLGWTALLPQMLAALGAVFALAGVGGIVGGLAVQVIPQGSALAAVIAYTVGMALFTAIMGNAFAAFPVMTAGIGLPLIVTKFGGDPTIMSAIGMLSGFCGTLMTPMAANFNLVPVALLNLSDRYAVIKAQIPTALLILFANTVLMYALVYR